MAQDPRETWAKLQQGFKQAQEQGRRGMGGGPKGALGGAAGLILLAGGVIVANNALFNGTWHAVAAGWESLY
jgi:prohibitin 2